MSDQSPIYRIPSTQIPCPSSGPFAPFPLFPRVLPLFQRKGDPGSECLQGSVSGCTARQAQVLLHRVVHDGVQSTRCPFALLALTNPVLLPPPPKSPCFIYLFPFLAYNCFLSIFFFAITHTSDHQFMHNLLNFRSLRSVHPRVWIPLEAQANAFGNESGEGAEAAKQPAHVGVVRIHGRHPGVGILGTTVEEGRRGGGGRGTLLGLKRVKKRRV